MVEPEAAEAYILVVAHLVAAVHRVCNAFSMQVRFAYMAVKLSGGFG